MNHFAPSRNRLPILALALLALFLLLPSVSADKQSPPETDSAAAPQSFERMESALSPDNGAFQEKTRENSSLPTQRYGIAVNPQRLEKRLQPLSERELSVSENSVPLQIGVGREAQFSSAQDGVRYSNRDGTTLRITVITSPGAKKLRARFEQFDLPPGDEVYVYGSNANSHVAGPYTSKGPWENGVFWSDTVDGESIIIEHYIKSEERPFHITNLSHIFREAQQTSVKQGEALTIVPQVLPCHNDANCFSDVEKNAVGRMNYTSDAGGSFLCTGTLLSDRPRDFAPFFITAAHCINSTSEAQSLEVQWFYRSTSCNSGVLNSGAVRTTFGGAALLATSSSNDSTLLRLLGTLPGGLVFSGWDPNPKSSGTGVFNLSHPGGEYLRRASGQITSTTDSCSVTGLNPGYLVTWSSGLTEPGSSGSGIWVTISGQNYLVGVDSCGFQDRSCSIVNQAAYGKFAGFYPSIQTFLDQGSGGICNYNINPTSASFASAGGTGSVGVTTSLSSCTWTVANVPSWISINSGSSGTGNGTVSYTVFQNTTSSSRSATLTIAGQAFTVTQSAPTASCIYQISPASQNFAASGGTGSVSVTTSLGSCAWTVANVPNWMTITSGSSGTGNGTVNYSVAANTTSNSRSATLTIAQQSFTVSQAAPTGGGGTPTELAIDDGSFENSFGLTNGGDSYRVNRLTPTRYPATLSEVAIYFRNAGGATVGMPFTVVVGTNTDGDANINNTTFQTVSATIRSLDQFNVYDVPDVTINSGDFVIGLRMNHAAGVFPFALDQTSPQRRSYRSLDGVTFALQDDASPSLSGNYGIRARLTSSGGGGGAGIVSLSSGIGQNGTISGSAVANTCRLGDTQYMIQVPNGATQLRIDLTGNQDVDLYARFGQAITVSGGSVVADYRADSQSSNESIVITSSSSPSLQPGTYFLAVSNCGTAPGSFTITATVSLTVAPRITGATVQGKKLIVIGENFDDGALLFMDGARQKKTTNSEDSPRTTLVAAKSGKAIPRGSTVVLQVQNNDGSLSNQFLFTRQ